MSFSFLDRVLQAPFYVKLAQDKVARMLVAMVIILCEK